MTVSLNMVPVATRNPKLCPIDPRNRTHFGEFLTFRKADVYISDSLWEKMDYPDYVRFGIDETEKVIGLMKTDKNDIFGVPVKMQAGGGAKGSGTTVVARSILEFLPFEADLENENVTFTRGFKVDSYFCFRFINSEKNQIKRRKKKL